MCGPAVARGYKPKIKQVLREVPLNQIRVWKEAQARRLDRSRIRNLAKSIRSEGLQNPPLIQKSGKGEYKLISGHHRLSALRSLGAKSAKCLVLTRDTAYDLEDAKAASVVENLHRHQMNESELANACVFLAEQVGKGAAARKLGMSAPTFRKYHGFAGVPQRIKDLVPSKLSRDEATRLYQAVPAVGKALEIVGLTSRLEPRARRLYFKILASNPSASHREVLARVRKAGGPKKRIVIELGRNNAAKLDRLAKRRGTGVDKLADDILLGYIRKYGR